MISDVIRVKARIHLKTRAEGGRSTGIKSGYRPNHVFQQTDNIKKLHAYIGQIQFPDQEIIEPGETKIVTVLFLRNQEIEQFMKVGQKWLIYEIPRLVAEGEILEI